ncbi:hypothetical protein FB45DRAFT_960379 [Roridomyces roridus]|uniref:Senescence domain-containing protein n=1 Tax=Roridomyces roridus TaxID=1738132 RepID=A0AAD7F865_9AGAR|nr:hypothetical protein FB45DRAFT_960379 [Roridomyces roridus]
MSSYDTDAFLLLNLSNSTLKGSVGTLALECVTIRYSGAAEPHVFLVLRMNETEIPIEPTRVVRTNFSESGARTYVFMPTEVDPDELVLTVALPSVPDLHFLDDVEVFDSILAQYTDLQGVLAPPNPQEEPMNINHKADSKELRGHLVLVNQDNGEVVGEFDRKFTVQEDPALGAKGHEGDPVVIELNESDDNYDANALQLFARAIPPEQQDWITKGATMVSHAITGGTTLLLTAVSAGSSYYTNRSIPSSQPDSEPPPLPPRAVAFLSSARTRKGLSVVHSVSGEAVKVTARTVQMIDGMIKSAMGNSKGKGRSTLSPAKPPLPPRAPSPRLAPPPPYLSSPSLSEKPALPPRRQPSPAPSSPGKVPPPPLPPRSDAVKLSTTTRLLLSADLILSTIDHSTRRILDSSTSNLGTVVEHKYGSEAAESSVLMAGTARNLALVYIDLRGVGRRALLRRAGKEFVKGRVKAMSNTDSK